MESLYRLFTLDGILRNHRHPISLKALCEQLDGCSRATVIRLIRMLRDRYAYPITYDHSRKGYYYDHSKAVQIPGLWFSNEQLQALLIIRQLLQNLQPNILDEYFVSLEKHVNTLLSSAGKSPEDISKRFQLIPISHQHIPTKIFLPLTQAILHEQVMQLCYQDIYGQYSERAVTPQRLTYYRDNWYLDAWCHLRQALRTFWVAAIQSVKIINAAAIEVTEEILTQHSEASYGIFTGEPKNTAHLYFTGQAAMRVRGAQWHAQQRQQLNEDGSVELWVPYSDHRELVMDILRYGMEVKVLAPLELQAEVIKRLKMTLNLYENVEEDQPVSLGGGIVG